MDIGMHLIASGAATVEQLKADAAAAIRSGVDSLWTNLQPGGWDPLTVLAALPGERGVGTAIVPTYPQHPETTYSVTYKRGQGNKPEGTLSPGGTVKVKEGMVFNVSRTGQS